VQIVAVTGQWGLAFALALAAGCLAESWLAFRRGGAGAFRSAGAFALPAVLLPVVLFLFGAWTLGVNTAKVEAERDLPVREVVIVQGSAGIGRTGGGLSVARAEALRSYLDLSRQALTEAPSADLVVWPETPIPGGYLEQDLFLLQSLQGLVRSAGVPLVTGAIGLDKQERRYNSAFSLNASGVLADRYDKTQLVPYGEFFPLRSFLGRILASYGAPESDFVHGTRPGVFAITGSSSVNEPMRVGTLICYESAFSRLARARVRSGAQALILMTSDQTFGTTAGPFQHADMSILRAVESGRYLVRAAATGVSMIIDPQGRVRERIGMNERGFTVGAVTLRNDQTPFVRWGDWFLHMCGAVALGAAGYAAGGARRPPGRRPFSRLSSFMR
jgi:apolipoprotein N-acyltransferase